MGGGTPPFRNRVRVYMKKELHRHRENAGTALNFCILKRIIKLLPDLEKKTYIYGIIYQEHMIQKCVSSMKQ